MVRREIHIAIFVGLLTVTSLGAQLARRYKEHRVQQVRWDRIPYRLGDWMGDDAQFDPPHTADPADSSMLRFYYKKKSEPIIVYVGFRKDLPTGLDVHTPELCYPAQGWGILNQGKCWLGGNVAQLRANEIVVGKANSRRVVAWWYRSGSSNFEGRIRHIYRTMLMGMLTGRADGSLVRLEAPFQESEGEESARLRISEFSSLLLPALDNALPK